MSDLRAELAALKSKLKPELSEEQRAQKAEEDALRAEIAATRAALREDENEELRARFANSPLLRFFDCDPDQEHPEKIEYKGEGNPSRKPYDKPMECTLYTRFVVRGAKAHQLDQHATAIEVHIDANGKGQGGVNLDKQASITARIAEACIVWPTAEYMQCTPEQHARNIEASLCHLGAWRQVIGSAAVELGGAAAAMRQAKSQSDR